MIRYSDIQNKVRIFKSFTGLEINAFNALVEKFNIAFESSIEAQESNRSTPRIRRPGGGRKAALSTIEDKLIFILFYFRFYPTQEVLGYFFGIGQTQANEWIHRLTPILNEALGYEQQLPARNPATIEQILKGCPGLEFIIDGTERPIQRPKDKDRQKNCYSGKKKRHTVKNIVITDKKNGKIKGLSKTYEGKKHDKSIADEEQYEFPEGSKVWKDTGFQGYEPANTSTYQPKKKPKGGELTNDEKELNKQIASERIGVEHSIGGIKVFRIVRDIYRNHKNKFDDLVMETACGLHNMRVEYRSSS